MEQEVENRCAQVWQLKVKNKCRFFMWLLLQCKLPTANRIIQRGSTANAVCKLCHCRQETTLHMVANCFYAKDVWRLLANRTSFSFVQHPSQLSNVQYWWEQITKAIGLDHTLLRQILTYATWNIWKECCRRVFDNKALPAAHLIPLIVQEVAAYHQAHATPVGQFLV